MKVGLVGCGNWGRAILRDLKQLGCKVHVVARSEASIARAKEGGADGLVGSIDDLPFLNGMVVATPSTTHAAVLEEAVKVEVPVFVEKPFTIDAASAAKLRKSAGERLFVMDKWRYHPGIEALRDIVKAGTFGMPTHVRTWRMAHNDRKSDTDVIWHLLPHEAAIVLEIMGAIPEPRVASVKVRGEPVEMTVTCAQGIRMRVSSIHPKRVRRIRVGFRGGACAELIDPYADHIIVRKNGMASKKPVGTEMPLKRELAAFVEHLRGGAPPKSSAEEGLLQVKFIEKARQLAGVGTG